MYIPENIIEAIGLPEEPKKQKIELNEPILPDNYPVYCGYNYVVNGEQIKSPISGSIKELKLILGVCMIRRCDIFGRIQ